MCIRDRNTTDGIDQNMNMGAAITWTNTVSYEKKINDHKISGLLGTEWVKNMTNTELSGHKSNSKYPGSFDHAYLNNAEVSEFVSQISTTGADWWAQGGGLFSYIGRLSYNFKERYICLLDTSRCV